MRQASAQGRHEESLALGRAALQHAEDAGLRVEILLHLSTRLSILGDYPADLEILAEAERVAPAGGVEQARILDQRARNLLETGQFALAEKVLQDALGIAKAAGRDDVAGSASYKLGAACVLRGRHAAAVEASRAAFDLLSSAGDLALAMRGLGNQAVALIELGRLDEAEPLLERRVAWSREHANVQGEALALGNLAFIRLLKAGPDATQIAMEACRLNLEAGDLKGWAFELGVVAEAHLADGELVAAAAAIEKAESAARGLDDGSDLTSLLLRKGDLRIVEGRPEAARAAFEEARERAAGSAPPVELLAWSGLGLVDMSLDDPRAALSCFEAARAIAETQETHVTRATTAWHLGWALAEAGSTDAAAWLEEARRLAHASSVAAVGDLPGAMLEAMGRRDRSDGSLAMTVPARAHRHLLLSLATHARPTECERLLGAMTRGMSRVARSTFWSGNPVARRLEPARRDGLLALMRAR
jgi:tetratricopeptide (TPR) repeat protein